MAGDSDDNGKKTGPAALELHDKDGNVVSKLKPASSVPPQLTPWPKGKSGNPGGLSTGQRQAKDLIARALADPANIEDFKKAWFQKIREGNVVILVETMNRIAGKQKLELDIELSRANPLEGLTPEQIQELARASTKPKK